MTEKGKLKRELKLLDVFCIASGAMISSGLFILPGLASAQVGPALFLSYIIASLFAIPTVLSTAELATAMPKAGGDYFFITRTMGSAAGTIGGLSTWFSLSLKSAFALIGMGAYMAFLIHIPFEYVQYIAVLFCILFMLINLKGTKHAGRLQVGLVLTLIALLLLYIIEGFGKIHIARYVPFAPYGAVSVFSTAGFIFISYGGLTKIVSMAEEIHNPSRNIPLGMILSLVVVGIIYGLVVFVTTGLLTPDKLHGSLTPISDGAGISMPGWGSILMAIGAILAFVSTANAGIMSASRYPMAMSRDNLIPRFLSKVHGESKIPHYAIIFTTLIIILSILFLNLELLVKTASVFLLLIFILINVSLIIMRESKIYNYQPTFKCPLYPWMQLLGIAGCLFLLYEMGMVPIKIAIVLILFSLLWYLFYGKLGVLKDFALIHIIERVTNKEIAGKSLRAELKEIIKERDDISEDRFDELIKDAVILDIKESVNMRDFFKMISKELASGLDETPEYIYDLLLKREKESSTVIRQGLAIPHIVTKGERKFKILLARCKEGVRFEGEKEPLRTIFVLAGSKDERNFHLKVLSAIAQVVQEKTFEQLWMNARDIEELRDMILLAERRRF